MAEVIGVASGIASLIAITAQITKITYSLISAFKHAPHSQELFLLEVLSLKDIVLQAQRSCEEAEAAKLPIKCPEALDHDTFKECCKQLSSIQAELEPGMNRVLWLMKEKKFKQHGEALRHFRDIFGALVTMNTLTAASQTYKQVQSLSAENDRAKLLRWLDRTEETCGPLPTPSPDTGAWFLESRQYQDWISIGGCMMLCCIGAPGIGKSMLASIAIQDLSSRFEETSALVTYYFCDFAAQQQQDTAAVLQSLLRQIITRADAQILSTLVQLQAKARHTKDVLILSGMLKAVCIGKVNLSVVFDAPDELEDPGPMLSLFKDLATKGAKILITGRDMGSSSMEELADAAWLRVEANVEDIAKFVECKLQKAKSSSNACGLHDLVTAISEKANGIFLLARILVDELLQMTTIKQMRKALEAMPRHLTQAYSSSLRRIECQAWERQQLAQRAISWITHARRRFSVLELQHALALDEDDTELDEDNIPNIDLLIKVCAGIVIVTDDGRVGIVHKTAFDFFRQHYSKGSHLAIGKTSLQYLRLRTFQEGVCKTVEDMNARLARMPFLSYAASYCADHIREGDAEEMLQDAIVEILSHEHFRSTAFQALEYKRNFNKAELAEEYFISMPHGQSDLHLAAYWNMSYTLNVLLDEKHKKHKVDQGDSQGWTPLHWACCKRSSAVIQALVTAGASISKQDSQGWTPLFWTAFNSDVPNVEYLLQNGAKYMQRDKHGWTPLTWATVSTSAERYTVVKILLDSYKRGCESAMTEQDESPLDLADTRGDSDLFKILMGRQEQLSVSINLLWSTGHFDIPAGNMWRVVTKAEYVCGIEHSSRSSSLLSRSIRDGKRTIMQALLELGALVNESESQEGLKRSPLHWAAFKEDPGFVRDLIHAGADVTCLDQYGQTPLHQAVLNGYIETATSLINAHSDVNRYRRPCEARSFGSRNNISSLKQTPLMLACGIESNRYEDLSGDSDAELVKPRASALEMVSLLLASGANPHAKDSENRSVMHYAVMSGQCSVVNRLLTAGATFEGRSSDGTTILHSAARARDIDILNLVIDANVDLEAADVQDKNVFHHLASRPTDPVVPTEKLTAIVDALLVKCRPQMLNAGCQVSSYKISIAHGKGIHTGATPLSLTFEAGNWTLADILYHRGAVLPQDFKTSTWMAPAVYLRSLKGVQLLLKLGVLPEKVRWSSFPLLDRDLSLDEIRTLGDIVRELVNAGLNINKPMNDSYRSSTEDPIGRTSFDTIISTAASQSDNPQFIQLLLDLGADPSIPGNRDMDSFHLAAINMNWNTLTTLFKHVATAPGLSTHWTYASTRFPDDDDSATRFCKALKQEGEIDRVWQGESLLQRAIKSRNKPLLSALLSTKADLNLREHGTGCTALHHAAFLGDLHAVENLIRAGADVNVAMSQWHDDRKKPSGLYRLNAWYGTPLHLAAMHGSFDVVQMLIANNADINADTGSGQGYESPSQGPTALHLTLSTGTFYAVDRKDDLCEERLRIAELLVAKGANVNTVANHLTTRDARHFRGHEKLWNLLQSGVHEKERLYIPEFV